MNVMLPYGKEKVSMELPDGHVRAVLTSGLDSYVPPMSAEELVEEALRHPVGSAPLCELSRGKRRITVISSDHTRPVPSRLLMPRILRELRRGNPDAEITILVATGCHRATRPEELEDKYGADIVRNEKIVIHDCDNEGMLVTLGTLPSGGKCRVNRLAVECDLLVAEGFIEPHFFAGFSGGRKSVLPGISSRETVLANHCAEFIADSHSRAGNLEGNPIHRDMLWAAQKAQLRFILNVVLNGEKQVLFASAGGLEEAHGAGCRFLSSLCGVQPVPADIAITTNGGYPLDQNIYQSVKGMTAAEATVRQGGVIIMLSQAGDGHGGEAFCRELTAAEDVNALMAGILRRGRLETTPDQWQAQILLRVLQKARVIFVSQAEDALVRQLHMIPAHSPGEALALAQILVGKAEYDITVIPDGIGVIVG